MKVELLKSKLQMVTVTEANVKYRGSITLDPDLITAGGFFPYEKVEVNNSTRGTRINTYIIPGKAGSGEVCLNGGAALHGKVGDKVHVLAYCSISRKEAPHHRPIIVHTDENNKVIR